MTTKRIEHFTETLARGELSPLDFMMMDMHRPMTDAEIEAINPQARVDKSVGPFKIVDSEAEGVGASHEEERPEPRCTFCFGPMPCAKHANVEHLDILTSDDVTVTSILAGAHNAGLTAVVVVGLDANGMEYLASSMGPVPEVMYHLMRGVNKCQKAVDTAVEIIRDEPDRA